MGAKTNLALLIAVVGLAYQQNQYTLHYLGVINESHTPIQKELSAVQHFVSDAERYSAIYLRQHTLRDEDGLALFEQLERMSRELDALAPGAQSISDSVHHARLALLGLLEENAVDASADITHRLQEQTHEKLAEAKDAMERLSAARILESEDRFSGLLISTVNLQCSLEHWFQRYSQHEQVSVEDAILPLDQSLQSLNRLERLLALIIKPAGWVDER